MPDNPIRIEDGARQKLQEYFTRKNTSGPEQVKIFQRASYCIKEDKVLTTAEAAVYLQRMQKCEAILRAQTKVITGNRSLTLSTYNKACQDLAIEPVDTFVQQVSSGEQKIEVCVGNLGDNGAIAIAEAMKVNSTATKLNLFLNDIGDEGAVAIAEMLKVNTSLTALNLRSNEIGQKGGCALGEMLRTNSTLTSINLYQNFTGPWAAISFANALEENNKLRDLDLSSNTIAIYERILRYMHPAEYFTTKEYLIQKIRSDETSLKVAEAFAKMLSTNTSLQELLLASNGLNAQTMRIIMKSLLHNTSINKFDVISNPWEEEKPELFKWLNEDRAKAGLPPIKKY